MPDDNPLEPAPGPAPLPSSVSKVEAKPPRGPQLSGCLVIACLALLAIAATSLMVNVALIAQKAPHRSSSDEAFPPYSEKFYDGSGDAKIALIEVHGVLIEGAGGGGLFGPRDDMVERVVHQVRQARKDDAVKALLLDVDSPGGGITESDRIHREVEEFRKSDPKRVVVVHMGHVAASGGYYVSAPASFIMAEETTITGSIGVITQGLNFAEFLKEHKVGVVTLTSGPNKALLSPLDPVTDDHKAIIRKLIMEMYERFLQVCLSGREGAGLSEASLRDLADGRIYTARQAMALKLVDGIGYREDAIAKAREMAGLTEATVIVYTREFTLADLFRAAAQPGPRIDLDLSLRTVLDLETPRLMYLWRPQLGD